MSIETYWTVVPIVGLCIIAPLWLWLRLTRPKHRQSLGSSKDAAE